jgi:hypothetical protein
MFELEIQHTPDQGADRECFCTAIIGSVVYIVALVSILVTLTFTFDQSKTPFDHNLWYPSLLVFFLIICDFIAFDEGFNCRRVSVHGTYEFRWTLSWYRILLLVTCNLYTTYVEPMKPAKYDESFEWLLLVFNFCRMYVLILLIILCTCCCLLPLIASFSVWTETCEEACRAVLDNNDQV